MINSNGVGHSTDRRLVDGARAVADTEVDAAGEEYGQRGELLLEREWAWLTASTPPVAARMFAVAAATRAATTVGGKATMCAEEWCSAYTGMRRNPDQSSGSSQR